MALTVKALDHIVLTVRNISATTAWYTKHLGMKHEAFTSPKDPSVERFVVLCITHVAYTISRRISLRVFVHVGAHRTGFATQVTPA